MCIYQRKRVKKIAKKFNMINYNAKNMPVARLETFRRMRKDLLYKSLVRSLRYFTIIRPVIICGVGLVSKNMEMLRKSYCLLYEIIKKELVLN